MFETPLSNDSKNRLITIYSNVNYSKIEIIIEDNGLGISEKNLEKLFKLDIHHTTKGTNNEQGTGLGLILCKYLLNSKIDVESQLGVGRKFIISFND